MSSVSAPEAQSPGSCKVWSHARQRGHGTPLLRRRPPRLRAHATRTPSSLFVTCSRQEIRRAYVPLCSFGFFTPAQIFFLRIHTLKCLCFCRYAGFSLGCFPNFAPVCFEARAYSAHTQTPLYFGVGGACCKPPLTLPADLPTCARSLRRVTTATVPPQGDAASEGEAAGAASENNLIINYLPSHVTEIELRVSHTFMQT